MTTLAFYSKAAVLKTLEWYLGLTMENAKSYHFKVADRLDDPRLSCLKKLEHAAHSLGSKVSVVYKSRNLNQEPTELSDILGQRLEELLEKSPEGAEAPYAKLGIHLNDLVIRCTDSL